MAILGFREIADAERDGFTFLSGWRKQPTQTTGAGVWFDLSMSPGNPRPNNYIGPSGVFTPMSQSSDGGIPHGGNVAPKKKMLRVFEAQTATAGATAWGIASGTMTVTGYCQPYALGYMTATTVDSSVLTPVSVASAVWAATAATNNAVGSMGEKLNDAGSAANPWTEVIESGYTAADILRLLASHAAGEATGLEGATPRFKSLDGTKTRIDGTYAAGERGITSLDAS